jgi:hypothetical protein
MLRAGEDDLARSSYHQSITLFRALNDPWGISLNLFSLAALARAGGDYITAEWLCGECLSLLRATGERWMLVESLAAAGDVALHTGKVGRARELCVEGLRIGSELSNTFGLLVCCIGVAGVAVAIGQYERATQLLAATNALLVAIDAQLWAVDRSAYDCYLAAALAQLDEEVLTLAWRAGQTMDLDQAVAFALECGASV